MIREEETEERSERERYKTLGSQRALGLSDTPGWLQP